MAEHSRFFDSLNPLEPDRVYTAEEFTSYFHTLITTGIMKGTANMLKVETSGSNMNTTVDTGTAFLIGRQYENDTKLSLTHEVEALGKSRIDRVVIRLMLNMEQREAKAFVKKGVAGSAPVVPPLSRTGDVYEISLAQVKVIGGQTYINTVDVTDERGNPDVCPWAGSNILPNFDDIALADLINVVEGKANRKQEDWITPVLQNGWGGNLKYRKDEFGVVHLVGAIIPPVNNKNGVILTMPKSHRTNSTSSEFIEAFNRTTGGGNFYFDVRYVNFNPNGEIVTNGLTTETFMRLNYAFKTE